jgi:hypothetical protein
LWHKKDDEKSGADSTTCILLVEQKLGAQWCSEIRTGALLGVKRGGAFPIIGSDFMHDVIYGLANPFLIYKIEQKAMKSLGPMLQRAPYWLNRNSLPGSPSDISSLLCHVTRRGGAEPDILLAKNKLRLSIRLLILNG